MASLKEVGEALLSGNPVIVYDFEEREGEADLVYPAWLIGPDQIYEFRTEAGGLICYVTESLLTKNLGIPWAYEILSSWNSLKVLASKTLRYGDRPAFTVWVNHIHVRTGISDIDRSLTIRSLDEVSRLFYSGKVEEAKVKFYSEFISPGHVPILASKSLRERRGHTELVVALFKLLELRPSATFAEILVRGRSATFEEAKELASRRKIPIVKGVEILKWCENNEVCWRS
ncbi:MAG: 3,4-dihydroxy-2-butanone-4-phosphate synthase [Acidilobaceae archaeon]